MRILFRTYLPESPDSFLSDWAGRLQQQGAAVLVLRGCERLEQVRAWQPDLIVGEQWATEEASRWATELRLPFVTLVNGPGQFEQFQPQCDLVVFDRTENWEHCRQSVGATATVCLNQLPPENFWPALRERLQGIVRAGRRRPTLSLCMTVANEAASLEQGVQSVAPFADEIIIGVDKKSRDETANIAHRLATRCFEFEESSPPHFPRMRNRALDLVTTDWALVLDGHEWIENGARIRPALETTAWSIEIETLFEPDENRVPGLAFPFPRLHRRHVRFTGAAAHEEVTTPLDRRATCLDIKVWHERKPGAAALARSQEKTGRELDHLREAWQQSGNRRALFYFANGLREAGRTDEAIQAYEEYLKSPNFAEEGWQARLYLARCYSTRQTKDKARSLLEENILQCPERAEPAVGLGHLLLEAGDCRSAAAWFRMAASLPQPRQCRMFVEVPVYRWGAWHGLALALDRLGDFSGAAEAEEHAEAGGAGAWAKHNIAWWRSQAASAADQRGAPL